MALVVVKDVAEFFLLLNEMRVLCGVVTEMLLFLFTVLFACGARLSNKLGSFKRQTTISIS